MNMQKSEIRTQWSVVNGQWSAAAVIPAPAGYRTSPSPFGRGSFAHHGLARRAFTVIELIVVVGIIVMLVGLVVGVTVTLHAKSEARQLEQAMKILDMALQEWEITAERQITYGTNGQPPQLGNVTYDIQEVPPAQGHELTHKIIEILNRNAEAKNILSRIDPELLKKEGDELTFFDPWGHDLITVFPGRLWNSSFDSGVADPDGTIRTPFENAFGICENRRIYFVSSGPDGEWGDLQLNVALSSPTLDAALLKKADDNVYSYQPLKTRPTS